MKSSDVGGGGVVKGALFHVQHSLFEILNCLVIAIHVPVEVSMS